MNDANPGGENHDAAQRKKGLSEERRRLLDAMMREHGLHGGERKAQGDGEGPGGSSGPSGQGGQGGGRRPPPSDDGGTPPDPTSSLVAIKASGSRPPFFCAHALLGSAFPYHRLAMHMDAEQPFYGLQSPGLDGTSKPLETIEKMAEHYIERMRGVQPHGPYYIGGYSFGGWIAFEMAQQLTAAGEEVALLAMLGASAPIAVSNPLLFEQIKYAAQYADDYRELVLNSFWSDAMRASPNEAPNTATNTPGAAVGSGGGGTADNPWASMENPWQSMHNPLQSGVATVTAVNNQAQFRYVPRPYEGEITLFATSEQHAVTHPDQTLGWKMLSVKEVAVHQVAGNHLSMLQEPFVKELAEKLGAALRERHAPGRAAS